MFNQISKSHYRARFLSEEALERKPNAIRSLLPLERTPGLISLLAGKPNPTTFPIAGLSLSIRDPRSEIKNIRDSKIDTDDATDLIELKLSKEDLEEGLQYSEEGGVRKLMGWVCGLQERVHGRKCGLYDQGVADEGWKVTIGAGSQDVLYKAIKSILNPGDYVLVESPVYPGVFPIFHSMHCPQVEIKTDEDGVSVMHLRSVLESWPEGKPKPKVFYTVPTGSNPTGATATTERRIQVLQLAREHDFLILEDDPYYYLFYGDTPRPPSYFALEVTLPEKELGRVVRFDSCSKVLSAGLRIGWASGPEIILDAMIQCTGMLNLQTPTITQIMTYSLLSSPSWGYDGFLLHADQVAAFYKRKSDVFETYMQKYLGVGASGEDIPLAKWEKPKAGLFFWFKIIDDLSSQSDEGDSEALVRTKAFKNGVLALPGTVFLPGDEPKKTGYVRASFSLLDEGDVEEAMKRLRTTILEARKETKSNIAE
ncbi:PLP-dependent transferase [Marasmius fiardii PR-910]|nr:PLP-dependent transferase [Marasmius fiardii PR-910]